MAGSSKSHCARFFLTVLLNRPSAYIPPRAAWAGAVGRNGTPPINTNQPLAPIHDSPVELPTQHSGQSPTRNSPKHTRINSNDTYYEDVDPRFVEPEQPILNSGPVPASLMPGHAGGQHIDRGLSPGQMDPSSSYESIQEGARSPAASDTSHFTSISQRGVNPNWRPPPNGMGLGQNMGGVPNRRPMQQQPQQRDVLNSNPDFELPGSTRGGNRGRAGSSPGQVPGMGGMGGMPSGGGRYPTGDM